MVRDTTKVLSEDEANLPYVKDFVKVLTSTNYNATVINKIKKIEAIIYQNRENFFKIPVGGGSLMISRLKASLTNKYYNIPTYHNYFTKLAFPKGDALSFLNHDRSNLFQFGNPKHNGSWSESESFDVNKVREALIKSIISSPRHLMPLLIFQSRLLSMKGYFENLSDATFKNLKDGKLLIKYTSQWESSPPKSLSIPTLTDVHGVTKKGTLLSVKRKGILMLAINDDDLSRATSKTFGNPHFSSIRENFGYISPKKPSKTEKIRPWDERYGYDGWKQIKYGMSDHKGKFDIMKNGEIYLIMKVPIILSTLKVVEWNDMEYAPTTITLDNKEYEASNFVYSPYWVPDKEIKELYDFEVREIIIPLFAKLMGSDYDNPIRPVEVMMINNEINYQYKRLELKYFGDLQGIKLFDEKMLDGWKLPQKPITLLNWKNSPFIIEEVKE